MNISPEGLELRTSRTLFDFNFNVLGIILIVDVVVVVGGLIWWLR